MPAFASPAMQPCTATVCNTGQPQGKRAHLEQPPQIRIAFGKSPWQPQCKALSETNTLTFAKWREAFSSPLWLLQESQAGTWAQNSTSAHSRAAPSLPALPSAESPRAVCACFAAYKPPGSGCTAPWASPTASWPVAEPVAHHPSGTRTPLRQSHWTDAAVTQTATRDLREYTESA